MLDHAELADGSVPFLGRAGELEALRGLYARAAAGERSLALIVGRAGSGKTRLLREFTEYATASGGRVLSGECDPVTPAPYRPFRQALEQAAVTADDLALADGLGSDAGYLGRLVPSIADRVGGSNTDQDLDPATERYRAFDAADRWLAGIADRRPVVLMLDDLHWADEATCQLLRHLARSPVRARLLVIAALRDDERSPHLDVVLAELARAEAVRIDLPALSPIDVHEMLRRLGKASVDERSSELAADLHSLTGGNAFLLVELWRSLLETGTLMRVGNRLYLTRPLDEVRPRGSVRDVVLQRLGALSAPARGVLDAGAAAGPDFEAWQIAEAASLDGAQLGNALAEAASRDFVVAGAGARAYRWTHELVRRAVYDGLPQPRRAQLHAAIAEALTTHGSGPAPEELLAHHLTEAGPYVEPQRAAEAHRVAARGASRSLAFAAAARHLQVALALDPDDGRQRFATLMELGSACVAGGDELQALDAYAEAAELARRDGDAEQLSAAAIGYESAVSRQGTHDRRAEQLLGEAAALATDQDSPGRAQMMACLGRTIGLRGDPVSADGAISDAVAMARRLGDPHVLAAVLSTAYAGRGFTPADSIVDMLTEARQLASQAGDLELMVNACSWMVVMLISLGRISDARHQLDENAELIASSQQPYLRFATAIDEATVALALGRFADAEMHAADSERWALDLRGADTRTARAIQLFEIRRACGRLEEARAPLEQLEKRNALPGAWRPALAVLYAELGDDRSARAVIDQVADPPGEDSGPLRPLSLLYLADAAALIDHAALAAALLPKLAPLTGSPASFAGSVAFFGSADRYIGKLATTLGDRDLARAHLQAAAEQETEMGVPPWLAWTQLEQARLEIERGDARAARPYLDAARQTGERLGMNGLVARADQLRSRLAGADAAGYQLTAREIEVSRAIAEGLTNQEIGRRLFISQHTAAAHVRSILRKTGCANRTQIASWAAAADLAPPTDPR